MGGRARGFTRMTFFTTASARLVRLAVVVREPLRGPIVSERVDLRHVLRRDDGADLEPLARRAAGECHREVHDQALDAGTLDLSHRVNSWDGRRGTRDSA